MHINKTVHQITPEDVNFVIMENGEVGVFLFGKIYLYTPSGSVEADGEQQPRLKYRALNLDDTDVVLPRALPGWTPKHSYVKENRENIADWSDVPYHRVPVQYLMVMYNSVVKAFYVMAIDDFGFEHFVKTNDRGSNEVFQGKPRQFAKFKDALVVKNTLTELHQNNPVLTPYIVAVDTDHKGVVNPDKISNFLNTYFSQSV